MKKSIIIMIGILLVCAKNADGQKTLIVPKEPKVNGQTFFQNFELDDIVPIETTDDCLISHINKAIRYKDLLVFADRRKSVFVMNIKTGKIETSILRQGQGPGEWRQFRDIAVDDKHGHILVYTDHNKLMFFDMKGQFLKEENLEFEGNDMVYHNGNLVMSERREGMSCYPYEFNIYDIDKKTVRKIGNSTRVDFHIRGYGNQMVKSKNIWFFVSLDYNLYKYSDGEIETPYTLTVKNPITKRLIAKSQYTNIPDMHSFFDEVHESKIIYGFSSPIETDRFIFLTCNRSGQIMINKQTSETVWEKDMKEEQLGGLTIINPAFPVHCEKTRIVFMINLYEWFEAMSHKDKIAPEWQEKISKMEIVEDSNPILLFYKEKGIVN
ncbi:MAG: 6-bladed beta-propeller [Prevotellaceae bacterium]|jgi:hypothetical protein|nr:6-bladed beta-propeller [Prevotellaceae bacterium]